MGMYDWARQEVQLAKAELKGNKNDEAQLKKTFEEILDEAAEKADKEYKELPPDPLEHP